ncbi:MAG: hypothetical protein V1851_00905 [Patescibacteria group bacterium]
MNFNDEHPELKEGEVFLTNGTVRDFHRIKCGSKRLGEKAYNTNGEMVNHLGLRPIFKKENDKHNFGLDKFNHILDDEPFR